MTEDDTYTRLHDFLLRDMRMSHVCQPVMLKGEEGCRDATKIHQPVVPQDPWTTADKCEDIAH